MWLLFHVGRVVKDLNRYYDVGYEYEQLAEYEKYVGRLIVKYKNKAQTVVRKADLIIDDFEIAELLPDIFDNDIFPGYDNVNVSWEELNRVCEKESWKTALENQKGVYLITDTLTGKMYVGSAYGGSMILGRWKNYLKTGNGGNVGLKELGFDYIKKNFRYTILDIYKSTTDDQIIIDREGYWKNVFMTRQFGYNKN
jgi:hypothetical protein